MAFYNFPLRLLKVARDADLRGEPIMTMERAVHRVTGEIADWFGLDAGHIKVGKQADIAVINPTALTSQVDETHEAAMPLLGGLQRLVRRNDDAVPAVVIGGRVASRSGVASPALGVERGFGSVLRV